METKNQFEETERSRKALLSLLEDYQHTQEELRLRHEATIKFQKIISELAISPFLIQGDIKEFSIELNEKVSKALNIERVSVWLFNEPHTELHCVDLFTLSKNTHSSGSILKEEEFQNEFNALKTAKFVNADDPFTDPRTAGYVENYLKPNRITSMLDAVIRIGDKHFGTLCFEHVDTPHHWTAEEIAFASQLGDQIAITLYNKNRKQSEISLKESEEKYRLLVDNSPDAIVVHSGGKVIFANNAAIKMMGANSKEELIGKQVINFVHPDSIELVKERIKNLMLGQIVPIVEEKIIRLDGKVIDVEVAGIPMLINNQKAIQLVIRDITERKKIETELKDSKEKLKQNNELLQSILDSPKEIIIFSLDKNYRYTAFTNSHKETMKLIWGVDIEIGMNMLDAIKNDEDREKAKRNFDRTLSGEYLTFIEEYEDRNLYRTFYHDRYSPIFDENNSVTGLTVFVTDITELQRMNIAIQKQLNYSTSQSKISSLIISSENITDMMIEITNILGNALRVDRCLIYEVDFTINQVSVFSEWLNPEHPEITSTKNNYPIDMFISGAKQMQNTKNYIISHFDDINPTLLNDQSYKILHETMEIKSLLWYPFYFNPKGYFLLVLNDIHQKRLWTDEELAFIDSVSKQVNIALEKSKMLNKLKDNLLREEKERQIQESLNMILRISTENISLEESFRQILQIIIKAPFLSLKQKGGIFVTDKNRDVLQLKHSYNLSDNLLKMCAYVPFGHCLCGRAASSQQIQYAGCLDDRHEIRYAGIEDHGHYNIPIISGNKCLGVIVVYLEAKHERNEFEVNFLKAASDILSSLIIRKQIEAELFKKSLAIEQSSLSILITDTDGNIEYVNPKFSEVTGYSYEEAIGKNPRILKSSYHDNQFYVDLWTEIKSGKTWRGELCDKKKDGSLYWENAIISPVIDEHGNITHFVGIKEDITAKKELNDKLLRSEEEFRSVWENSVDAMRLIDEDGIIINVNQAFCKMFDLTKEELIGKTFDVCYTKGDYVSKFKERYITNSIPRNVEAQIELYNHKKFWVEVTNSKIEIKDNPPMLLSIFRDITDKKKIMNELIAAKEKAEEMNRVKSHFFATMSHELRTPFVGIMGFAELLYDEIENQEHKEMAGRIIQASKRLTNTLNQILNMTKLEFDKQELYITNFDAVQILEDVYLQFEKTAKIKNLEFRRNIKHDSFFINSDEKLVSEILINLVNNAIKYTDKGSVEITANKKVKKGKKYFVVEVKDTGIGIPKEKQEIIWEDFRQASEGTSRKYEGTGLGLSIAKRFAEAIKANLYLKESVPNVGSVFVLEIPVETDIASKENGINDNNKIEHEFKAEKISFEKKKILYVEDDELAIDIVKRSLSNDYEIDCVTNAKDTLEKVNDSNLNYDLIFMDVNLGHGIIDGIQLTAEIRQTTKYKKVPIVALTAYASEEDKSEFLSKGMDYYLSKPFTISDLRNLVKNIFSK